MLSGVVEGPLTDENLSQCDLILIAVYPGAAIAYLKEHAAQIGSKPVVIDCCGTKRVVCAACFPLARQYGFTYLGGYSQLRLQICHGHPVPQRAHGAGAGGSEQH